MDRYRSYAPRDDNALQAGDGALVGVNSFDAPENLQPGQCQAAVNMDFTTQDANTRGGWVCLPALGAAPFDAAATWTGRTAAAGLQWKSIAYGNGLFVAVARSGTSNRVMTSPDGINWVSRTSAADNDWQSITYGNGLFVAVALDGANRVMTSADGITWLARTAAEANQWRSVSYGSGLYVAVADTGTNRAMTSPDGITWTAQAPPGKTYRSIIYGGGTFLAVSSTTGPQEATTSTDGIAWTSHATPGAGAWLSVTFGKAIFVATGLTGEVMTSSDGGATWTLRTAAAANSWEAVAYGNSLFIAVSTSGTNRVMTSADGITWVAQSAASGSRAWNGIANGANTFVAVADTTGAGDQVMTAGATSSVYASGIYSDPNDAGSQWMMLVGSGSVGFYAFGRTARTVLISGYTVSAMSTVVQCNNQVYIFRGTDSTPLYWAGDWSTTFTVAPTTTPAAGFGIIPNSNQATFYQNRLWVIDGKDTVAASDVLDFTAFDEIANDFNLNTGSSDYLVTTFPFGVATLVVFKNKSIIALQYVDGVLSDVAASEITRQVGAIGINSVVSVGPDLVYMSDQNVNLLSLTSTSNALQHKTQPLSRNISSIIRRVNWSAAAKVSMAYHDNKLYIALPLDNSPTCNAVAVYNFITEQWFGEWNFAAELGIAIQGWLVANYFGATRLHAVTDDGRIFVTGEGYNDISGTTLAEITTSLTTRAYVFDNENRISRRFYADFSTNRPDFSVTAYVDGASEHEEIATDQTYSRANSWLFNDSTYALSNANDDYNRAFRQDYATGPDSVQPGTGIQPEMLQEYRYPLITRRKGRLSWFKIDNTQGRIMIQGVGNEARAGDRGSLVQVG